MKNYTGKRLPTEPLRAVPRLLTAAGVVPEKKEMQEDKAQSPKKKKGERRGSDGKKGEKAVQEDAEGMWRHLCEGSRA